MKSVANFAEYKKKFNLEIVYLGDIIEWQDYDGLTYEAMVTKIEHKPLEGFSFSEEMDSMPMWEKEEYCLTLDQGMLIIGDIVVRKIVKSPKSNKKGLNYDKPYDNFVL